VQTLVSATRRGCVPDNRVIGSIRGCNPWRSAAGLIHAPSEGYRGRICRSNFVSPDLAEVVMKSDIRPLSGVVRHS